jgi:hypothetical protein
MKTTELIEKVLELAAYSISLNESELAKAAPTLARRLQKAIEQTETLLDMAYCATPSKSELAAELDAIE